MSHDPKRPIGKGVSAYTDENGATFVKSLICDPLAVKFIKKGILTAYSVGMSWARKIPDPRGIAKAIITAGELVELTICDSPSNVSCGITMVAKSASGTPQYVGKAFVNDGADPFGGVFKSRKEHSLAVESDKKYFKYLASPNNPDPLTREMARATLGR